MVGMLLEWCLRGNELARYAVRTFEGCRVKTIFRITADLLAMVQQDLMRPHPFACERVGFLSVGLADAGRRLLILAREYRPVLDADYLDDVSVDAMMGPAAIQKALQWAMGANCGIFHVHTHGGFGLPNFSKIDLAESAKFVPCFFNAAPQLAHGAIVLSEDAAKGLLWPSKNLPCQPIQEFSVVDAPIRKWRES